MLRDKLQRLSGQIAGQKSGGNAAARNERYAAAVSALGAIESITASGTYLKIITDLYETYLHGRTTIYALSNSSPSDAGTAFFFDWDGACDRERLLFFDMETTGLSGGSGTVPFLIGCGSLTADGFQVRQYFLPDYPDEAAMLEAVRAEITEETILVSYNGRAFDLPILIDRLVLHRIERNLKFRFHIDLLHPVRRLYRRRLRDCSLGNVERVVLEFFRFEDIPGYMVPAVYFNWLATGQTQELARVVRHNLNDIVSLLFILYHFYEIHENPTEKLRESDDLYSLSRIALRSGESDRALEILGKIIDDLWMQERFDILLYYSLACKRAGGYAAACPVWEKLARRQNGEGFAARIELAKHLEHRAKDIRGALRHAEAARNYGFEGEYIRRDLEKRIARLQRKLSSSSF